MLWCATRFGTKCSVAALKFNINRSSGARKGLIGKRGVFPLGRILRGPAAVSDDKGQHVTDRKVGKTPGG